MPEAIVHIGTPKTGTSAIQKFLFSQASYLRANGFSVLPQWAPNHSPLTVLSGPPERWDEPCSFHSRRLGCGPKRPNPQHWAEVRAALGQELRSFVANSNGNTLIFSSEGLYTRLLSSDIVRFRELMDDCGLEVQILAYVREPLSFRISQMGQLIRAGWHVDLKDAMDPQKRLQGLPRPAWPGAIQHDPIPFEMYSERLAAWERAFPERVQVRLYDSRVLWVGVVADFCSAVDIPLAPELPAADRVNEALSWPVLKALNEVNRHINRRALLASGDFNTHRRLAAWTLTPGEPSARFRPSLGQTRVFDEYFRSSNEALRAAYFPARSSLWESPAHMNPEAEASALELSEADRILVKELLDRAQNEGPPEHSQRSLPRRLSRALPRRGGLVGRPSRGRKRL